jgi:hypothetical protein
MDDTSNTVQPKLALSRIESILFDIWINIKNTSCFVPLVSLVIATNMNMVKGVPSIFFHWFDIHVDALNVPGLLTSLVTTQILVWTDIGPYPQ